MDRLTPERRREQTRQHLIDAAADVFMRRGFHGASLDEVAAAAGFTKGAVYSNFKNKDDLFVAVLDCRVQRQMDTLQSLLAEAPDDEVHLPAILDLISTTGWDRGFSMLYLEFVLYAARNPAAQARMVAHNRLVFDTVEQIIAAQSERFGVKLLMSPRSVATISTALFDGLATYRILDPEAVTDDLMKDTLDFMTAATRALETS